MNPSKDVVELIQKKKRSEGGDNEGFFNRFTWFEAADNMEEFKEK